MCNIKAPLKYGRIIESISVGVIIGVILARFFDNYQFISIISPAIFFYLLFLFIRKYQQNTFVNANEKGDADTEEDFLGEASQYKPSEILRNIHSRDLPQQKAVFVGVGCAGINMIDFIVEEEFESLDTITIDTDLQKLMHSKAKYCLYLGSNRDIVDQITSRQIDDIYQFVKNAKIVFLLTGLGGRTGSEATLQLIEYAIKMRKKVHVLAVTPFKSEGNARNNTALLALKKLKLLACSVTAISNNDLIRIYGRNIKLIDGFNFINEQWLNIVSAVYANPEKHHAIIINQTEVIKEEGFQLK